MIIKLSKSIAGIHDSQGFSIDSSASTSCYIIFVEVASNDASMWPVAERHFCSVANDIMILCSDHRVSRPPVLRAQSSRKLSPGDLPAAVFVFGCRNFPFYAVGAR